MNVKFSTTFDEKLKEWWFYEKHPQLLPFIGKNYGNGKFNKLLIIGESHYIESRKKEEWDNIIKNWYEISNSDLSHNDIGWTTTRGTITESEARFNGNIRSVLRELGEDLSSISFMNFFQRPAYYKQSIEHSKKDIEIANETLRLVCDIILPDCLLFVSKKSYWKFDRNSDVFQNKKIEAVSHPACAWWYKNGGKHGKQKFIDFIKNEVQK